MFKKFASAGIGLLLVCSFGAVPAHAVEAEPLRLADYTVSVAGPATAPVGGCDGATQFDCGAIEVTATFAGLTDRARPTTPAPVLHLTGTVDVLRTYGCVTSTGKRIVRYDTKVRETLNLNTRRGTGVQIPATGDTVTDTAYAFLFDAQPRNCPAGTTATTSSIKASRIKLRLESQWAPIPSKTYSAPGTSRWVGSVPAPTTGALLKS